MGNIHATDVGVILCADQSPSDIRKNGCDEDNIVYRRLIEAVVPVSNLVIRTLGNILAIHRRSRFSRRISVHDPDNNIIESDESSNYWSLSDKMGSNNRFLDPLLGCNISVPVIIIGATIALGGVAVVVIWGRRIEAMKEYAERKYMMVYTDDDMEF